MLLRFILVLKLYSPLSWNNRTVSVTNGSFIFIWVLISIPKALLNNVSTVRRFNRLVKNENSKILEFYVKLYVIYLVAFISWLTFKSMASKSRSMHLSINGNSSFNFEFEKVGFIRVLIRFHLSLEDENRSRFGWTSEVWPCKNLKQFHLDNFLNYTLI